MSITFRAAYWTDHKGGELVLTAPEHAHLSDEDLLSEARAEAERAGVDLSYGSLEVGEWTDSRQNPGMDSTLSSFARETLDELGIDLHRIEGGLVYMGDQHGGPYDDPIPTVEAVERACEVAAGTEGELADRFEAFHDALASVGV